MVPIVVQGTVAGLVARTVNDGSFDIAGWFMAGCVPQAAVKQD
jgi:hypothetical protein